MLTALLYTCALAVCVPGSVDAGETIQLAFLRARTQPDPSEAIAQHVESQTTQPAARRAIDSVDFMDEDNPDRHRLQTADEATRGFPYDANGFPDWMKALNSGLIKPRTSLTNKEGMEVLDLDIVMRNTKEMPFVKFPHRSHTLWLACSNCHPDPFEQKAGAAQIRMNNIFRGQYCGKCHDRVAFVTFFSCARCHSVPQTRPQAP